MKILAADGTNVVMRYAFAMLGRPLGFVFFIPKTYSALRIKVV